MTSWNVGSAIQSAVAAGASGDRAGGDDEATGSARRAVPGGEQQAQSDSSVQDQRWRGFVDDQRPKALAAAADFLAASGRVQSADFSNGAAVAAVQLDLGQQLAAQELVEGLATCLSSVTSLEAVDEQSVFTLIKVVEAATAQRQRIPKPSAAAVHEAQAPISKCAAGILDLVVGASWCDQESGETVFTVVRSLLALIKHGTAPMCPPILNPAWKHFIVVLRDRIGGDRRLEVARQGVVHIMDVITRRVGGLATAAAGQPRARMVKVIKFHQSVWGRVNDVVPLLVCHTMDLLLPVLAALHQAAALVPESDNELVATLDGLSLDFGKDISVRLGAPLPDGRPTDLLIDSCQRWAQQQISQPVRQTTLEQANGNVMALICILPAAARWPATSHSPAARLALPRIGLSALAAAAGAGLIDPTRCAIDTNVARPAPAQLAIATAQHMMSLPGSSSACHHVHASSPGRSGTSSVRARSGASSGR